MSNDAKVKYEERLKRVNDAIAMEGEPDRVPCIPYAQTYPVIHAGHTMAEAMYDMDMASKAYIDYTVEYEPDMANTFGSQFSGLGPMFDKLGLNWFRWAGMPGDVIPENSIHQYIETEYMEEDEYPELLGDFSGWIMRKYLPRSCQAAEPLASANFSAMNGYGLFPGMLSFLDPRIVTTFQTFAEAGAIYLEYAKKLGECEAKLEELGFPLQFGATTTVPYDAISDNLRGTMGMMEDVIMQPDVVHAAIERMYPGSLYGALAQLENSRGKWAFIPLHKGMDGFLSPEQYDEFYWPTLKRLVDDLIAAGQMPYVFTEGPYNSRLERLAELPEGKVVIHFENVDMAEAKRIVGEKHCLSGGFNARLLERGTVQQVEDEVKRLLDICAPGGGYIFDLGDTMDDCKPENVEAMFRTVRDYGTYR